MFDWLKSIIDPVATEPQPAEIGTEIAMERDPVTGEMRTLRPDGGDAP